MTTTWNTVEAIAPEGITELVRGSDLRLVARLEPAVRSGDAALDCSAIERIDAAGISALILLHERARSAGHFFLPAQRAAARGRGAFAARAGPDFCHAGSGPLLCATYRRVEAVSSTIYGPNEGQIMR